jgi:CubicO group peptidase (beta-lactamase class C family)
LIYGNIIDSLTDKLVKLPDQTELSIAIVKNKSTDFLGLLKKENRIQRVDNRNAAFEIGSVTKAFTANVLAQMVAEWKVNLDDQIGQYIPFHLKNKPPISLKQLVSHTSGLPRLPDDFFSYPDYLAENRYLNYNEERLVTYLTQNLKLASSPGEQFLYSNLGAGVLSYIRSKIEGKEFAQLVAGRIFKPLNMINSTFDKDEIKTSFVKGIDENGSFTHHWDGGILNGCLGIISTASRYVEICIAGFRYGK